MRGADVIGFLKSRGASRTATRAAQPKFRAPKAKPPGGLPGGVYDRRECSAADGRCSRQRT
jgi:hypothetical protein